MNNKSKNCPSYLPSLKSKIIGIKMPNDNKISMLATPLTVSKEFLESMEGNNDLLTEYRYTGTCVEKKCGHWGNNQCGLIKTILKKLDHIGATPLPKCGIRKTCRWFSQEGKSACEKCTYVTYHE